MLPRPSTAVPSLTMATSRERQVYSPANDGLAAIALHTSATPGVYASDSDSRSVNGNLLCTESLPPS